MNTQQPNGLYGPFNSAAQLYQNPALRYPLSNQQQVLNSYIQQQQQPQNTVINDITTELSDLSNNEKEFIMSSKEYIAADAKYQQEFSAFLIQKFSAEFLQSHQRTMEELLHTIRLKKDEYKDNFAGDIKEVKNENEKLAKENTELAKVNLELQEQLKQIESKLASKAAL